MCRLTDRAAGKAPDSVAAAAAVPTHRRRTSSSSSLVFEQELGK